MTNQNESKLRERIDSARSMGRSALIPFCVAGHPSRQEFGSILQAIDEHADLIEIGLPFSDPVADGPVIAEVHRERARAGVSLEWLLQFMEDQPKPLRAASILFSYLNPLLAFGLRRAFSRLGQCGFAGLLIPDLPLEESGQLSSMAKRAGLALIHMITPLTPMARQVALARASSGFLYAVLRTGTTGTYTEVQSSIEFLRRLRSSTKLPICAGFGLRHREQVDLLKHEVDGLIIGSALVEHIAKGLPPGELLRDLHNATIHTIQ